MVSPTGIAYLCNVFHRNKIKGDNLQRTTHTLVVLCNKTWEPVVSVILKVSVIQKQQISNVNDGLLNQDLDKMKMCLMDLTDMDGVVTDMDGVVPTEPLDSRDYINVICWQLRQRRQTTYSMTSQASYSNPVSRKCYNQFGDIWNINQSEILNKFPIDSKITKTVDYYFC